jgi:hypothetical protein
MCPVYVGHEVRPRASGRNTSSRGLDPKTWAQRANNRVNEGTLHRGYLLSLRTDSFDRGICISLSTVVLLIFIRSVFRFIPKW